MKPRNNIDVSVLLRLFNLVLTVTAILLAGISVQGQSKINKDIFKGIDESQQTQLIFTLEALIKAQHEQKWDELYEFIPAEFREGETKEQYIARLEHCADDSIYKNFIAFSPEKFKKLSSEIWVIDGCGEWKFEGKSLKQFAYVTAYRTDTKWYLTEVLFDLPLHSGFIPCRD